VPTNCGTRGLDAVVTREDALRAKPHPDLYTEALRRLRLSPADAVAVEDSANGVAAAAAAGLTVVAVPNAVTSSQQFPAASAVLDPRLLNEWINERT